MTDRSDFKPLQILPAEGDVILAVTCVADQFTIRRSVIIKHHGADRYSVHERAEEGSPALMNGSYDLTLSAALNEAARRIEREESYL